MNKVFKNISLLFVLFFLSPSAGLCQGNVSLAASVDKATITIGDLITYSVSVTRDEDVVVELPSLGGNLGQFEIRDYTVHDPEEKEGKIIDRVDYIISTFDVGDFEIPPVGISYFVPPDSTEQLLKTEKINITVESVKPSEEGDILDIKPPWEILFNWRPWIVGGLIALLVILLIVGLIIYLRKRKKGESFLPKKIEIPRPPHEIAYEELQRVQDSDFLEQGKIKQYYSEISEIIRLYIEGRYQVIALELTTTDVMLELQTKELSAEHLTLFEYFFVECDLVKFAKYIPSEKQNIEIMEKAIRIVDETKWIEVADSEIEEDIASSEVESRIENEESQEKETVMVTEEDTPENIKEEKK